MLVGCCFSAIFKINFLLALVQLVFERMFNTHIVYRVDSIYFSRRHGLASCTLSCLSVSDLPRVTKLPPDVFVARGLPARLDCPTTANPPVIRVVWSKDDRVIAPLVPNDSAGSGEVRLVTDQNGSLLFQSVLTQDEGQYSCTPYSSLGVGQASRPVHLYVRGSSLSVREKDDRTDRQTDSSLFRN